jgi:hypothetical protein
MCGPGESVIPPLDSECRAPSHRVVRLALPHAEVHLVRLRLVHQLGPDQVSPILKVKGGLALVLCKDCGGRAAGSPAA